jgi:hypothetical protein
VESAKVRKREQKNKKLDDHRKGRDFFLKIKIMWVKNKQ